MTASPAAAPTTELDEETARSEFYGLLALVYYAPPAPELIASLGAAPTDAGGAVLEAPWRALVALAREMGLEAITQEYNALFGGVGKPEVYLYGSYYLSGFLNEKPLARLRAELASMGLARAEAMSETEDHIAYLCEVMRTLIAGDDGPAASLTRQQAFFAGHIQPWAPALCAALQQHPKARFYGAVAELTRAYLNVEAQGFDMLDS